MGQSFRQAFVVVSVVLGESPEVALAQIRGLGGSDDESLVDFCSGSRSARARAMARVLSHLFASLDAGTLS